MRGNLHYIVLQKNCNYLLIDNWELNILELIRDIDKRGVSKIYVKEKIYFNKEDVEKYHEIFEQLKKDQFIVANKFEDIYWSIPDSSTNRYLPFIFNLDMYPDIKLALKIYSLIQIAKGKSIMWIKDALETVKKVVFATNGFKDTESLQRYLYSDERMYYVARDILKFIDFYKVPNSENIKTICESLREGERRNRDLPSFMDIFMFDEIVNDYFRNMPIEDSLRYTPIQLWWAISNIIPMRPTDFLKLKRNCVSKDNNGLYWITISRSKKIKKSVRDTPPLQTIQINKQIFDLVQNFKFKLSQIGIESIFLIPQSFYEECKFDNKEKKRTVVEDRWQLNQFSSLLKHFHKKVVKGLYDEDFPVLLLPSHTRHLAIINLFLQGFNMLSISRMAGHDDLHSSSNYYSHVENFIESSIYNLAKSSITSKIGKKFSDGFIGWRREVIDKGKKYSYEEAEKKFLKVDYGFCEDEDNFPKNCSEDCRPCHFYIFKPSIFEYKEGIKWLESYSKDMELNIKVIVKSMIATSQALSSSYRPDLDESLKSKSRQLQQLMDHKTIIEYTLLGERLNE